LLRARLPLLALVLTLAACRGREAPRTGTCGPPRAEGAPTYDDATDAECEVAAAVAVAKRDRKRVLLVLGANWCPWCRKLDATFQGDADVAARLAASFVVVHVSTGDRGSDVNAKLIRKYLPGAGLSLPFLIVLDESGGVVERQDTGALEDGDHHDPQRIMAFLDRARGG
jgi:thiol-disulfide isomerase/thioredoxin